MIAITVVCLLPFSGRAFHIDDPLFVWSAQQITQHPFNPYGFKVNWYGTSAPMSQITKNPPLACYYGALVGLLAGWSERAWHIAFLLVTLALVLGLYRLARHFTRYPLIACLAALLTPGVLVSASGVMCDVMMLAFWVWATALWVEGLESDRPGHLASSAVLAAASALTKYFGVALIPLLLAYAIFRKRRLGSWAWYLLIPIVCLSGYQFWTHVLYGRGLFSDATRYALLIRAHTGMPIGATTLSAVAFLGGCALTGLIAAPFLWSRRQIVWGATACALLGVLVRFGYFEFRIPEARANWDLVSIHFAFFVAGGFSLLALALNDWKKARDADSVLLGLWVLGTFIFAGFLNWTINARSILPLIPAAGILIARQLERKGTHSHRAKKAGVALALFASAGISLWVVAADTELANSARTAVAQIAGIANKPGTHNVFFEGHWGFQYYMQLAGTQTLDRANMVLQPGDMLVVPDNNVNVFLTFPKRPDFMKSEGLLLVALNSRVSTMSRSHAAGFYSASTDGPLPFVLGSESPNRYHLYWISRPIRILLR